MLKICAYQIVVPKGIRYKVAPVHLPLAPSDTALGDTPSTLFLVDRELRRDASLGDCLMRFDVFDPDF